MGSGEFERLDAARLGGLSRQAHASERLRDRHNLHAGPEDPVQRMCVAMEPGSYIRPHRHPQPEKWELLVGLSGRVQVLLFDDAGALSERLCLEPAGELRAVELRPGTWHTLVAERAGSAFLEIKPGPYQLFGPGDHAPWSPAEGSDGVSRFLDWCRDAKPRARYAA